MRFTTLILALLACLSICAQEAKTYTINTGDFTEFTVANNLNVIYRESADSAGLAVFQCQPDVASAITFSNTKGKLKIQVISDNAIAQTPTVTVYSSSLRKVNNWGDSTIVVERLEPCTEFNASVIGNGNIAVLDLRVTTVKASVKAGMGHVSLYGRAQEAKFTLFSAGAIEAGGLEVANARCNMVGTGSIDCHPTSTLKIYGAGSGHIYYLGNPEIKNYGIGVKITHVE